jgi:23S rRNA (cytidine1920-2'-O)/16S rRNA (cytidine1409-2'-O)-methyltransferase
MPRTRIDTLLIERGLVESRAKAQALIMAGQVRADGQVVLKSSTLVDPGTRLELKEMPRFVSRRRKLDLAKFGMMAAAYVPMSVSTGGLPTACYGAAVYALDVVECLH